MVQNYTENDLLLYFYQETTPEETLKIKQELVSNNQLRSSYEKLTSGIEFLDSLGDEPSQTTIDIILEFSKAIEKEEIEQD